MAAPDEAQHPTKLPIRVSRDRLAAPRSMDLMDPWSVRKAGAVTTYPRAPEKLRGAEPHCSSGWPCHGGGRPLAVDRFGSTLVSAVDRRGSTLVSAVDHCRSTSASSRRSSILCRRRPVDGSMIPRTGSVTLRPGHWALQRAVTRSHAVGETSGVSQSSAAAAQRSAMGPASTQVTVLWPHADASSPLSTQSRAASAQPWAFANAA